MTDVPRLDGSKIRRAYRFALADEHDERRELMLSLIREVIAHRAEEFIEAGGYGGPPALITLPPGMAERQIQRTWDPAMQAEIARIASASVEGRPE